MNEHPLLNLAVEPFHKKYGIWNPEERSYINTINDKSSMDKALKELFSKYNGMKVLSYQLPEYLYEYLLDRSDNIILFLTRRNLLKAIISILIAEQTQVWQKSDYNDSTIKQYHSLKPLQIKGIDGLENRIFEHKKHIQYWNNKINMMSKNTWKKVNYEDLYYKGIEYSLTYIDKIFNFLEINTPKKDKLINYINPIKQQVNNINTYRMVPNIDKINDRFGSNENGFLFNFDM